MILGGWLSKTVTKTVQWVRIRLKKDEEHDGCSQGYMALILMAESRSQDEKRSGQADVIMKFPGNGLMYKDSFRQRVNSRY